MRARMIATLTLPAVVAAATAPTMSHSKIERGAGVRQAAATHDVVTTARGKGPQPTRREALIADLPRAPQMPQGDAVGRRAARFAATATMTGIADTLTSPRQGKRARAVSGSVPANENTLLITDKKQLRKLALQIRADREILLVLLAQTPALFKKACALLCPEGEVPATAPVIRKRILALARDLEGQSDFFQGAALAVGYIFEGDASSNVEEMAARLLQRIAMNEKILAVSGGVSRNLAAFVGRILEREALVRQRTLATLEGILSAPQGRLDATPVARIHDRISWVRRAGV